MLIALLAACSIASTPHPEAWQALQDRGHVVWASAGGPVVLVQDAEGHQELYVGGRNPYPFGQISDCEGAGDLSCNGGTKATFAVKGDKGAVSGPDGLGATLARATATEVVFAYFGAESGSGSPETRHLEAVLPDPGMPWTVPQIDAAIASHGVNPLTVSPDVALCVRKRLELDAFKVLHAQRRMPQIDPAEFAVELLDSAAEDCLRR